MGRDSAYMDDGFVFHVGGCVYDTRANMWISVSDRCERKHIQPDPVKGLTDDQSAVSNVELCKLVDLSQAVQTQAAAISGFADLLARADNTLIERDSLVKILRAAAVLARSEPPSTLGFFVKDAAKQWSEKISGVDTRTRDDLVAERKVDDILSNVPREGDDEQESSG